MPVTSDVQDANITFFRTTVSLYCVFAASGSARGCRFVLTLINGTWENIDLLRPTAGGTVSMKCAHTSHTRFSSNSPDFYIYIHYMHNDIEMSSHTTVQILCSYTHMHAHMYKRSSLHIHTPHSNRHNYIKIVVFDVREDSTSGNLPVLPHVVESDQIPCEEPTRQPNKPHKSNTTYLLIRK